MALEGRPVQRCILAPVQIQPLQASTQSSSRHAMPSSRIQKPVTSELDHTCWTMKSWRAWLGVCDCLMTSQGNRGRAAGNAKVAALDKVQAMDTLYWL